MKLFTIFTLVLTLSSTAFTAEMPEYMKDGVITVTLKDGKTYTFSSNEYMVVKRGVKPTKVETTETKLAKDSNSSSKSAAKKYRATLLVGYGLNGKLKDSMTASTVDVRNDRGLIGGLAVQADLNEKYHLMGEVLSNESFLLGIGKGF